MNKVLRLYKQNTNRTLPHDDTQPKLISDQFTDQNIPTFQVSPIAFKCTINSKIKISMHNI